MTVKMPTKTSFCRFDKKFLENVWSTVITIVIHGPEKVFAPH